MPLNLLPLSLSQEGDAHDSPTMRSDILKTNYQASCSLLFLKASNPPRCRSLCDSTLFATSSWLSTFKNRSLLVFPPTKKNGFQDSTSHTKQSKRSSSRIESWIEASANTLEYGKVVGGQLDDDEIFWKNELSWNWNTNWLWLLATIEMLSRRWTVYILTPSGPMKRTLKMQNNIFQL